VLPPAKRHRLSNGSAAAAAGSAASADPVEFQQQQQRQFDMQQQQQQHGLATMPPWFAAGLADAGVGSTAAQYGGSISSAYMQGHADMQLLDDQLMMQQSMSPGSVRLPRASLGLLGHVPVQPQACQSAAAAAAEYAHASQLSHEQQGLQLGGWDVQQQGRSQAAMLDGGAAAGEGAKQMVEPGMVAAAAPGAQ
jgi:hypothetical protein